MENQDRKDKQSLLSYLKIHLVNLILMCKENKKNILVIVVFVAVIGVVLALGIHYDGEEISQAVAGAMTASETSTEGEVFSTQETALEEALAENVYPEAVNLVKQYYKAMEEGDLETIKSISNNTGDKESIIITTKSKYIESYPQLRVYTKSGPDEGSLIAYVYYYVKFLDHENAVPGISPLYLCVGNDGSYYINQTVSLQTKEYIDQVTAHDDVIDLYNKVQVEYNEVLAGDEELNQFLAELKETLMESVSLELARLEEENAPEVVVEEEESLPVTVVTKVKTTDVVNVRSSDSIEADRIGQTTNGQVLDLIEELVNGWSKVEFEGKEGYIKTEFLVPEETMVVDAGEDTEAKNADSAEEKEEPAQEEIQTVKTTEGKLTDTVNIRKGPGTNEAKLGQLSEGTTVQIIEKMSNGWTKIKYEDDVAYVKSDYVK